MSTTSYNAKPPTLSRAGAGTTPKLASPSSSDWLGPSLLAARTMVAASENAPVPFVKGVFGTILIVLETIDKVKKNRESLKQLCGNVIKIMKIVESHIVFCEDVELSKLENLCADLESTLQEILHALKKRQSKPKGVRGHFKELLYSSDIAGEILDYEKKIQELQLSFMLVASLDTNRQVHEMGSVLVANIPPKSTLVQDNQNLNNCPPPSRIFQGRQAILDNMKLYFGQDSGRQHIYVLHGLGGVGKTQIALKFIRESRSQFSSTCLIDTSTRETVDTALKNIALQKKIGDTAEAAMQWFTAKNESWLLFFDNADDPNIDLNKFFPQCDHGNIIITTRNPGLSVYSGTSTRVDNLEEEDAIELLFKSAGLQSTLKNRASATAIVKELVYLPLAIIQAGAFIAKSRNLEGYLTVYSMNKTRLLSEKPVQSHDSYTWTVYTTWQMSFEKLSPLAARFLQLCSLLYHNGIQEDFFVKASKYQPKSAIPSQEDLQGSLEFLSKFMVSGQAWDYLQFQDITAEIMAYSLMEFDTEEAVFSMHPLVHDWCQSTIIDQEAYKSCMIGILGMCISYIPKQDIQLEGLRFVPHLDALVPSETQIVPDFRDHYAAIYQGAGQYSKAAKLRMLALEKYRELLGDDHRDTLRIMSALAETQIQLASFTEAKILGVLALQKQKQLLGDDHPETLDSMDNLALIYQGLGQFMEALKLNIPVLEKRKRILGKNHPDTLISTVNLADTYNSLGQFTEALELEIYVVEQRTLIFGDDHPETLLSMNNLAFTYSHLGQCEKALGLHTLVHGKRSEILGEDHPDTMLSMANLAGTYHLLGQYQDALRLQIAIFEQRKRLLGDDNLSTMRSMANLAVTYNGVGQFQEALELDIPLYQKRRQIFGEDHPDTMNSMANLANTYRNLGQFEEALRLGISVLKKRIQVLGEDHPETLRSMANLAVTHKLLGEFDEALKHEIPVLQKRKQILGMDHVDTLRSMNYLAVTHGKLGKFEDAKKLQVYVLEKHQQMTGDNHPNTLRAMIDLAATYYNLGNLEEADKLAIPAREKLNDNRHPDTLLAIFNLAAAYRNANKVKEAEELDTLFQQTQTPPSK